MDDIVEREVEGKVQKIVDENMKKILRYQTMVKQIILMWIKN